MGKPKPLKVLQVVGAMNRAGTETMLMNIYRSIDREKVHFDFISYSNEPAHYDAEIERLGGNIFKLSKSFSVKEIYEVIKKNGPYDVVHAHTLFHCGIANLAAKLAGVKVRIAHAHTTFDHSETQARKLYMKSMGFLIKTYSTNLLACSLAAGSYLFRKQVLNNSKYTYFPNVINDATFLSVPPSDIKKFKITEGLDSQFVIGHIGRFSKEKNQTFLVEVMKKLLEKDPTLKLLLVGDGELKVEVEEKAKSEGLRDAIRFIGVCEDIPTILHSMDVFVFPSTYEGLGLVLLEAQACGVPCVVSEAIQPEADVQLGLISQLSLAEGADTWAGEILKLKDKKEKNILKVKQAFDQSDYSLKIGIENLMQIYSGFSPNKSVKS